MVLEDGGNLKDHVKDPQDSKRTENAGGPSVQQTYVLFMDDSLMTGLDEDCDDNLLQSYRYANASICTVWYHEEIMNECPNNDQ